MPFFIWSFLFPHWYNMSHPQILCAQYQIYKLRLKTKVRKNESLFQVKSPGIKVSFTASWAKDPRKSSQPLRAAPHLQSEMWGHMISKGDHL